MTPLPPLCLTGASGFIGRRLTAQLAAAGANDVTLLLRDPARLAHGALPSSGDSCARISPATRYRRARSSPGPLCSTLPPRPGRANAAQMQRLNVDATGRLLAAAKAAGARHFVFVSSVSAGYRGSALGGVPTEQSQG